MNEGEQVPALNEVSRAYDVDAQRLRYVIISILEMMRQ